MMVCMILCYLYFIPSKKYPNEQYNIENFGVLMCPLSILIFFFFFFLGPFGVPLGRLAHLQKFANSKIQEFRESHQASSWDTRNPDFFFFWLLNYFELPKAKNWTTFKIPLCLPPKKRIADLFVLCKVSLY